MFLTIVDLPEDGGPQNTALNDQGISSKSRFGVHDSWCDLSLLGNAIIDIFAKYSAELIISFFFN